MAQTIFNAKVQLSSASLVSGDTWDIQLAVSDSEGIYSGLDTLVNDIVLLDTSPYTLGTITRYKITQISSKTFTTVDCRIDLDDDNPGVDLSFVTGLDSFICRPTFFFKYAVTPSPGIQSLPDKFVTYVRNADFYQRVDKVIPSIETRVNTSSLTIPQYSPVSLRTDDGVERCVATKPFYGIALEAIPNGSSGQVQTAGIVANAVNYLSLAASTPVYPVDTGLLSDTPPTAVGTIVFRAGYVSGTADLFIDKSTLLYNE